MNLIKQAIKMVIRGGGFLVKPLSTFAVVCILLSVNSQAIAKDFIDAGRINDILFGTWSNSGNWSTTTSHCVVSATSKKPRGGASTVYYNAKVRNRDANDGFYLYLNGNKNATGNEKILISIEHRDLLEPSAYESLSENQYDTHPHNGQFDKCVSGDNSELRVNVSASELATKVNGDYSGRYAFVAQNDDRNGRARFDIEISVQRSTEVKISKLDPVNFGQHSGVGNLRADERLCVYSSTTNGSYRLSINAANQDAGGNFYLAESISGALIPMAVRFSDSATGSATNTILNGFFNGFGNNSSADCGGGNNATLTLSMDEADLQAASTGNYSETLVILVEPE